MTLSVSAQQNRIEQLRNKLESIVIDAPDLHKKAEINVNNVALSDFLQALATAHNINVNIRPELSQISISNNFSNATVADVLIFANTSYLIKPLKTTTKNP